MALDLHLNNVEIRLRCPFDDAEMQVYIQSKIQMKQCRDDDEKAANQKNKPTELNNIEPM